MSLLPWQVLHKACGKLKKTIAFLGCSCLVHHVSYCEIGRNKTASIEDNTRR